jgi:ArsR family transcriptional regulator
MDMQLKQIKELFRRNLPLLSALGDSQRQQILLLMTDEHRLNVGEITRRTKLSRPAVSHHIKVLKDAHLLSAHREGTRIYYQPKFDTHIAPMRALIDAVEDMICTYDSKTKGIK